MNSPRASSFLEHARSLADRLIRPGVLDSTLASGLFVVRPSQVEDWVMWRQALFTQLERYGALILLAQLAGCACPELELRQVLARCEGVPLRHGPRKEATTAAHGDTHDTFASILGRLVAHRQGDLLLMLEGVDRFASHPTDHLFFSLKAARDELHLRPGSRGRFLLIGVGEDRMRVRSLVRDSRQPFFCAEYLELTGGN